MLDEDGINLTAELQLWQRRMREAERDWQQFDGDDADIVVGAREAIDLFEKGDIGEQANADAVHEDDWTLGGGPMRAVPI